MFKYILKRIGLMILTFLIIIVMCFVLIKMLPVSINVQVGQDAELIKQKYAERGYFKPIPEQLVLYAKRVLLYGDFGMGTNLFPGQDVWDIFIQKLPATMIINFYAMLFSVPIGLGLGIFAALKKNKWQDQVISTAVMLFISVPSFIYAFLVQYLFGFKLGWLPLQMKAGTDYFSKAMFISVLAPVMSLAFGSIAGFTRYTRAELTEVLTSEFMLLARAKGLTRGQATLRHALRNSMVPIFPMILGEFIGIIGGSLIIENVFGVPGVGELWIKSINALDYDFFMLLAGFYTFIGLAAGIIIDLSYGIIDPRIRMGAK